jgi:hypothetical protein
MRIKKPFKNYRDSKYLAPIAIGALAFLFVPFEALDTYRYYLDADRIATNLPVVEFIAFKFFQTFDFIYYLLQYYCISLNIPVQSITGVSVALLYAQSFRAIDIVNEKYNLKYNPLDNFLLHLFVLISVSYIMVWSLGRNATGIMFVAYGINYMLSERKIRAAIFFALAIFTHFGLIFYLAIFFAGYFFHFREKTVILRTIVLAGVIAGFIASLFIANLLQSVSNLFFITVEYDYQRYLEIQQTRNILEFTLGWGDKVMFVTTAAVLIFSLYNVKRNNPIISGSIFVFIWLSISLGFSQMHTQRTLLLLIPLQGIIGAFFLFANKNSNLLFLYRILIMISVLTFMWNIYSYRGSWVFELPF